MSKNKQRMRYFFIILSLSLIFLVFTGFSNQSSDNNDKSSYSTARYGVCAYCNEMLDLFCLHNSWYAYSYPHTSTCTVDVYQSNAVRACLSCGRWDEYYAAHDCYEVHSTCSKYYDSVCVIGKYYPFE